MLPVITALSEVGVVVVLTVAGQLSTAKEICVCLTYLTTVFLAAIGTSVIVCSSVGHVSPPCPVVEEENMELFSPAGSDQHSSGSLD